MSKIIFSGLESSGKSLQLAMLTSEIAYRNSDWKKKSGVTRSIASNLRFSKSFFDFVTIELEIPIIYWDNIDELIKLQDCDVLIDEVGNYFDSRMWTDLSLDARRWLTQGAKSGIEIYGTAQDFAQVDKAFRRLVNELIHITKIVGSRRPSNTKPPVNYIWGICMKRHLDPLGYEEDKKQFQANGLPSFFFISKKYCEIFDTTQKILRSKPMPYKHQEKTCELDNCGFMKVTHT